MVELTQWELRAGLEANALVRLPHCSLKEMGAKAKGFILAGVEPKIAIQSALMRVKKERRSLYEKALWHSLAHVIRHHAPRQNEALHISKVA